MKQLKRGKHVCKCGAINSDMNYRAGCEDCMGDLQFSIQRAKRERVAWLERELNEVARAPLAALKN